MSIGECMEYAQKLCDAQNSADRNSARAELRAAIGAAVAAERDKRQTALDRALTVCRCAARVIDSSAYQGISDEDCDLEVAVRNWRALRPNVKLTGKPGAEMAADA